MVDALRSARRVLRKGGSVVDLQPAADRARRQAIAEGAFSPVVSTHGTHRTRYRRLADLRWLLRQNENWTIAPTLWRKLAATWARRPDGAQIEIRQAFSLAVLRKRR